LLVALTAALAGTGRADVLFVDDEAPPGGDGLAWDTAYPWLRDALARAAASGGEVTEIRVAQGTYRPDLVTTEPRPTCCVVHDGPGCDVTACEETVCFYYAFCCDTTWDAACVALAGLFCGDLCEEEPEPPPTFHLVDGVALRGGYAGLGAPDPDARDIDAFPSILSGDIDDDDDLYPTGCCTLTNNTATQGGALWVGDSASVTSSVLWGDEPEEVAGVGVPASVAVMFSDVQGGFPGPGNIAADPLFVDPVNGDYRLAPGSPCIDAGQSQMKIAHFSGIDLPCDVLDLDEDGDTIELLPVDFDGRSRFADDPDTPDTGCAAGPVVDMGAWEFGAAPVGPRVLYADLTGDRVITARDFLIVLAQWGPCDDPCCVADVGLMDPPYDPCRMFQPPDGTVDGFDVFAILGFWGF
jgi:hypothetical protein